MLCVPLDCFVEFFVFEEHAFYRATELFNVLPTKGVRKDYWKVITRKGENGTARIRTGDHTHPKGASYQARPRPRVSGTVLYGF